MSKRKLYIRDLTNQGDILLNPPVRANASFISEMLSEMLSEMPVEMLNRMLNRMLSRMLGEMLDEMLDGFVFDFPFFMIFEVTWRKFFGTNKKMAWHLTDFWHPKPIL